MTYDLIIRGGTVVDGTGRDPYIADVAVMGDTVSASRSPEFFLIETSQKRAPGLYGLVLNALKKTCYKKRATKNVKAPLRR